jgi:hypothetical protein
MMRTCSINIMLAERFMRDMFIVFGINCKYGLYRFALSCFGMCWISINFPRGGGQPPPTEIAKLSERVERGLHIRAYWTPFTPFRDVSGGGGDWGGIGWYRTRDDMRHPMTPQGSSSIPRVSMGYYGSHHLKIVIPGDGPHIQKSIVDKQRSGGSWVRWGLFWASVAAGVAGWVLGKINLNE